MSQSSQSQRERRQAAPPQSGQVRTPEASARERRGSNSSSETSQRFNPSQFDVSETGVVSIQKRRPPAMASSPVAIMGAYTGGTSPTVTVQDGGLVLVLGNSDVIYPCWVVPGDLRLGSGGTLDLYFTAAGIPANLTVTVDMYHSPDGVAIPATATTTAAKSVVITVAKESVLASFPIGGSPADTIRFKITASGVAGSPGLHAARVRYTPEYAHTHSEARG